MGDYQRYQKGVDETAAKAAGEASGTAAGVAKKQEEDASRLRTYAAKDDGAGMPKQEPGEDPMDFGKRMGAFRREQRAKSGQKAALADMRTAK